MPRTQLRTTVEVTVADVYGAPMETLGSQLGRREQFVDFRRVTETDRFLTLDRRVIAHDPNSTHRFGGPRLIVGTVPVRRYTFTETGTEAIPTEGQWYMNMDGVIAQAQAGAVYASPYMILERTIAEL